jgi:hypothetical protein
LGEKVGTGKDGFLSFMKELDKHGIIVETMRNKQDKAYGFRFLYERETFKASEIGREFGYRSLFRQFGLEDVKPQIGQTVVPIYQPQEQNVDLSTANTLSNISDELLSANLLNVHGEDYAETAFQRKIRTQQKKKRGRRW